MDEDAPHAAAKKILQLIVEEEFVYPASHHSPS